MILADRQRLPTQLARPARARRAYQELVLGTGRLSPRSSSVRSMRRWRSWKWRLAGIGDEKGRSGPVVRICERERRGVDVRNGGRNRSTAIAVEQMQDRRAPRRLSRLIEDDRSVPLRGPIPRYPKPTFFYDPSLPLDCFSGIVTLI